MSCLVWLVEQVQRLEGYADDSTPHTATHTPHTHTAQA